jgi:nitrogen regulatory protein P-II 1
MLGASKEEYIRCFSAGFTIVPPGIISGLTMAGRRVNCDPYEESEMKYVIAVIQPDRLDDVLDELNRREIHLVTVTSVLGRGRQKGVAEVYRSHTEAGSLLRKIKLEIAVNDEYLGATIEAITTAARTGSVGDGKIFVLDLAECTRIRTGETGNLAIG